MLTVMRLSAPRTVSILWTAALMEFILNYFGRDIQMRVRRQIFEYNHGELIVSNIRCAGSREAEFLLVAIAHRAPGEHSRWADNKRSERSCEVIGHIRTTILQREQPAESMIS